MSDYLSGLDESQLRYFLSRVKEVANSDEAAVLSETKKLLQEIQELFPNVGSDDSRVESRFGDASGREIGFEEWRERYTEEQSLKYEKESTQHFKEKINQVRARIDRNDKFDRYEGSSLMRVAESWFKSKNRPNKKLDETADEINRLHAEAVSLAKQLKLRAYSQIVDEMLEAPIRSVTTVKSIIKELNDTAIYFQSHLPFTDELKEKIRQGKERATWYRAGKKLAEAKIAEADGNSTRAKNLKKEAATLLAQDWAMTFPGEISPHIVT